MGILFSFIGRKERRRKEAFIRNLSDRYTILIYCSHFLQNLSEFNKKVLKLLANYGIIDENQMNNPSIIKFNSSNNTLNLCVGKIITFQVHSPEEPNIDTLAEYLNTNYQQSANELVKFHAIKVINAEFSPSKCIQMNYFGYIEEETNIYSISKFKNILSTLNPYFLQSPYHVSINITDVRATDHKKYFIIKIFSNKLRSLDAMTILSILHEICEGTVSISQIIQQLNQKISSKDHKNLIISKFFYFGSSYAFLSNVWKNRYQTTDNDIDFHSYAPIINRWVSSTFVPFCLEY